jgi:pyrroline-5-carboxylate reductase
MAAGYALGARATEHDATRVHELLSSAGEAILLDEELLDAVTGLSGSGPAFVARLVEAFTDGGVGAGLDPDTARRLTLATFAGTARLLAETGISPEDLVAMVSSPGGTTVAGREILENSDVADVIARTIQRAAERSRELGA